MLWPKKRNTMKSERERGVNPDPIHPLPNLTTWYTLEIHLLSTDIITLLFIDSKKRDKTRKFLYGQLIANDSMSNAFKLPFADIQDAIIKISEIKFVMSGKVEK